MKEARLYVDFNEMLEDDLVSLSKKDYKENSEGKLIELKEGLHVKIYSDDLSACNQKDNLVAEGVVEFNAHIASPKDAKWNCRINRAGIYNESQG